MFGLLVRWTTVSDFLVPWAMVFGLLIRWTTIVVCAVRAQTMVKPLLRAHLKEDRDAAEKGSKG